MILDQQFGRSGLFADDTSVFTKGATKTAAKESLNEERKRVEDKAQRINFTLRHCNTRDKTTSVTFLRVCIDSKFKWNML